MPTASSPSAERAEASYATRDPLLPPDEAARLVALDRYDVLDTPKEERFDRITRMVRRLFRVPITLISFIDGDRQWYKSYEGLGADQVPRETSFCKWTIRTGEPLVVGDAQLDDRFRDNPFVTGDPNIRFYLGVPLRTKDGFNIGTMCVADSEPRKPSDIDLEMLTEFAEMAMQELELRNLATRDGLTGAWSRRAFKEEAIRAIAFTLRHRQPLSCVTLDVDHFKAVNDTYGHPAGDVVLQQVVAACDAAMRQSDVIGRLGGEEFAMLLPHTTLAGAIEASERIRLAVAATDIKVGDDLVRVTASFGMATIGTDSLDIDALLKNADKALYAAKGGGRNRTMAWSDGSSRPAPTPVG